MSISIHIDESNELYGTLSIPHQSKTDQVIDDSRKSIQICERCLQEILKDIHHSS